MLKKSNSLNFIQPKKDKTQTRYESKSFESIPQSSLSFFNNPNCMSSYSVYNMRVKEVSYQEAKQAIFIIEESIMKQGWFSHIKDFKNGKDDIEDKEEKTSQDLWNLRCYLTKDILNDIKQSLPEGNQNYNAPNVAYVICYMGVSPIGIMVVTLEEEEEDGYLVYPEVNYIVTHPGVKNCAYLLMEKAVKISYEWGCYGKLKLIPATDELSGTYQRMGFKPYDNGRDLMVLNPKDSPVWTKINTYESFPPRKIKKYKMTC
ncbi:hypothetical protein FE392_03110 [Xenorhabdus sp. 12]|uniref:N-acetyltransferase domain-containing protein n=1 Tax=Xenorhabdus santafensis TaxID=2582833 RepID=A0ABU4S5F7_9GAMM|nr:hypothetical protein [Xenorhabdus sp. 12]MDX7986327.1 hypothetical protein [Xenorhabdus sp. 12]